MYHSITVLPYEHQRPVRMWGEGGCTCTFTLLIA